MLDHDLPPDPPVAHDADAARWLTICCLLADADRAGRALIAELQRWPAKVQRHECPDDAPRQPGRPKNPRSAETASAKQPRRSKRAGGNAAATHQTTHRNTMVERPEARTAVAS